MTTAVPSRPPRPESPQWDAIPADLRARPQWVTWRYQWRDEKWTKVPYNPRTGQSASSTGPTTWGTFATARQAYDADDLQDGVGYVFAPDDPYCGVDLDHCLRADGTPEPWAAGVIAALDTYTEITPSGTGLHLLCVGSVPGPKRRRGPVEMYDQGRYFTMTGRRWPGTPLEPQPAEAGLAQVYQTHLADAPMPPVSVPPLQALLSDTEIVAKARRARNGADFAGLYDRGDLAGYDGDDSRADAALCALVAFYTRDPAQIERIVGGSALGRRAKWRARADYRRRTIDGALALVQDSYRPHGDPAHIPKSAAPDGADPPAPALAGELHTDYGNAERLVREHGADLRYTTAWGWMVWDGARWKRDETGETMRRAKATIRGMYTASWTLPEEAGAFLRKHAAKSESAAALKAMITLAASEHPVASAAADFDGDPWLLNTANGTLDLRAGDLRPHHRADLLTRVAPVVYDGQAACPHWRLFLHQIFNGDTDQILFLQRAIGYALTGSTREQVMFILYGTGANGKSTLLNVLQAVLGDYAQSTPATTLLVRPDGAATNDLARLAGARFVAATESEEGKRLAEALIKQMTGGDKLVARYLRQEFFEFVPVFKLFFATNHKPVIRGTDLAIWRRIHLIPFSVTIPPEQRDATLTERLIAEAPGILAWAVEGCRMWQARGLAPPASVQAATEGYRSDMDLLAQFLAECCAEGPAGKYEVTHKELYKTYAEWADDAGEKPMSSRAFSQRLQETGRYTKGPGTGNILTWYGLRLLAAR
jgi:putative DNA primase/helicase